MIEQAPKRAYVRRAHLQESAVEARNDLRPDLRADDVRPPIRNTEDPLARAAARTKQLMEHGSLDDYEQGTDKYFINPDDIPEGWSYEWKRNTVYGKEDPSYQVGLSRMGWEAVPPERHPAFMPKDWRGETIERDGMVLMERPQAVTDRIVALERKKARDQVRTKEEQLGSAPANTFDRVDGNKNKNVKIKKEWSPLEIPAD